jgi:hypothetical protein
MKRLTEEIGRNYHTIDTNPIDFFHDDRVDVEIYPNGWGEFGVQIVCPILRFDSGLRNFHDEDEATNYARKQYQTLITTLDNNTDTNVEIATDSILDQIEERVIRKLLLIAGQRNFNC